MADLLYMCLCVFFFSSFFQCFPNLKVRVVWCDVVTKSTLLGNPIEESQLRCCPRSFTFSLLKYHSATSGTMTVALAGGSPWNVLYAQHGFTDNNLYALVTFFGAYVGMDF